MSTAQIKAAVISAATTLVVIYVANQFRASRDLVQRALQG